MFRMPNRLSYLTLALLLFAAPASAQTNATAKAGNAPAVNAPVESDRSRDGLIGPVRRVRTEVAKLVNTDGKQSEAKHTLVELASYDVKGNKVENQYFPIAGATLTGKEVYKYDEKGNISEMTLLNTDGTLLSTSQIQGRAGMNKAKVALARRLAVIMHRMLADGTPFNPTAAA